MKELWGRLLLVQPTPPEGWAAVPPSTTNVRPVTHEDAWYARNSAAVAMSSGRPSRRGGMWVAMFLRQATRKLSFLQANDRHSLEDSLAIPWPPVPRPGGPLGDGQWTRKLLGQQLEGAAQLAKAQRPEDVCDP